MNKNTLKLTTGAMFIAIFTMILIINRQTGMMFENMIMFILPIPMVAFTTKYGLKSSVPVMIGMVLMSLIFGTISTIFYAASECFIGLVLGDCLYKRADATKTILLTILLSTIANLLCTIVMAPIFGFNLAEDIAFFRDMINELANTANIVYPEGFINDAFLMRLLVISMAVTGMMQGYVIYTISVLILRRLRFTIPRPKSLYEFHPPKWSGPLAAVLAMVYVYVSMVPCSNEILQTILQCSGICGSLYLMLFGFLALMLFLRKYVPTKILCVILAFLILFSVTYIVLILGVVYIVTDNGSLIKQQN